MCIDRRRRANAAWIGTHIHTYAHTHHIDDEIQHNMPHPLLSAFEHIHQAPRMAMCARDMMLWHIKSGDCHIWQRYLQLLAHALEDIQIMVIMEYIGIKLSPQVAFCNILPPAIQAQLCYMLGTDTRCRDLLYIPVRPIIHTCYSCYTYYRHLLQRWLV